MSQEVFRSEVCPGVEGWGNYDSQKAFEDEVRETVTELKSCGNGTRNLYLQLKDISNE